MHILQGPLLAVVAVLALQTPAWAAPADDSRPLLALSASTNNEYRELTNSIYSRLSVSLSTLNRFEMVNEAQLTEATAAGEAGADGATDASKLALRFVYGIDEVQNGSSTSGNTTTYSETWVGHVTIINGSTGKIYKQWPVNGSGSSTDGYAKARTNATENFIASLTQGVREAFKLEAQVIARSGRTVKLNVGAENGVKEGTYFEVIRYGQPTIDPTSGELLGVETESVGQVLIGKAYPRYAEAFVVRGTYGVKEKDQLRELPSLRNFEVKVSGFAELSPATSIDGAGTATSGLSLMPRIMMSGSTLWPQTGLTTSTVLSVGAAGYNSSSGSLAADLGLSASYEVIPEFVSSYIDGGVGGLGVFQSLTSPARIAGSSETVTSANAYGLNAYGGLGARLNLFGGLSVFGGARYRTGNSLSHWTHSTESKDTYVVPATLLAYPTLNLGGLSYLAGLNYAF
jgi:hypothetical protein